MARENAEKGNCLIFNKEEFELLIKLIKDDDIFSNKLSKVQKDKSKDQGVITKCFLNRGHFVQGKGKYIRNYLGYLVGLEKRLNLNFINMPTIFFTTTITKVPPELEYLNENVDINDLIGPFKFPEN